MTKPSCLLAVLVAFACLRIEAGPLALREAMPHPDTYTHLWWAEGFPGSVPGAPWRRVIETGRYAIAMDTETLEIPHLGSVAKEPRYGGLATADNSTWEALPPAELELAITVEGKRYLARGAAPWSQFEGPRLIDSGRFLQRVDVTGLHFADEAGLPLAAEARLETVAWPDRLALILAARPDILPIPVAEGAFGRIGGGFGCDGTNHLEIPHREELEPAQFTLELWVYIPVDYQPSTKTFPWIVCKNAHEQAEGNYGIVLLGGRPQGRLNLGGGRENAFTVDGPASLKVEAWHHLAMSYDGDTLRLHVNGDAAGETKIGRARVPGKGGLAFGRRQDNSGDGYHFRGVLDEIRLHARALSAEEVKSRATKPDLVLSGPEPVFSESFRSDGVVAMERPRGRWRDAKLEIRLEQQGRSLEQQEIAKGGDWTQAAIAWDPTSFAAAEMGPLVVSASEIPGGKARPVAYDAARGWHRVDLDGIVPLVPEGAATERSNPNNDAIERVKLVLSNPSDTAQIARLVFEKTGPGFRQRLGAAITGMSAILRDAAGNPTGIPVQLSKNWHQGPEGGVYAGTWFHGFSMIPLPPRAELELELTIVYGHWGGLPAASHAQLCLVGWGSNQLWDQSAMGSWGESICYEPDQAQGRCAILDVRPMLVKGMRNNGPWQWTHNVGGGDVFRLLAADGSRVPAARMRTVYERQGPCLTEVTYAGRTGEGLEHRLTTSLARTDDLVRATYRLRLDVAKETAFSRFVIFQIGADSYSYTGERKMAWGNEGGLVREWATQWGGDILRTEPVEATGRIPWISLHEAVARRKKSEAGAWANRGLVIREWKARLGGKDASPWLVERGVHARGADSSTVDLVPPPGVTMLLPGDYVEATIEFLIVPQLATDYYGPNEALRAALTEYENTWRIIHREAVGNDRVVEVANGELRRRFPDIEINTTDGKASFSLMGGLGFVPVTFRGLNSHEGHELRIDGVPLDQGVHGNDFWQTDHDPATGTWSRTYNLPSDGSKQARRVELVPLP